jgi:3-methyladenine DNA glycosylase AlkD
MPSRTSAEPTTARAVIRELRAKADSSQLDGMARFGISTNRTLGGIGLPALRAMAKRIGRSHQVADGLWASGIHEARILAAMVDDPLAVTEEQMEAWAADFDSWDVVDGTVSSLFDKTPFAWAKVVEWSSREEEFVKRAAFAMMAALAVHDKNASDAAFVTLLPIIEREAGDPRNFVRKAVNWAIRQIGKRNAVLNAKAIATAERIHATGPRPAKWVASDALRELRSDPVQTRLRLSAERRRTPVSRRRPPPG